MGREEVRREPGRSAVAAAATSARLSSDMDLQMALPRALLLLLFLHLSPLGGRSYPLGGLGPASEQSGIQELLDRLGDSVLEPQAERMTLEPLHQDRGPAEASETRGAAPTGVLGPRTKVLQALRGLRSPKMMRNSGCFGRRLDRIGSFSGLGCNVLRRY